MQDDLRMMIERMAKIGSCRSASLSPDGNRVAFVSDLNGVPQVWTVATTGGWPELVTTLDDQVSSVAWSPTGEWLAFLLAPGGGMNQQVYIVHPDGTGLRCLTKNGKENNWLGGWTHDGRKLLVASNQRDANSMDAYLVDVETGAFQLVAQNDGIGTLTDVSRDGRYALLSQVPQRSDSNLYLIDVQRGERVLLTPHEGPGTFEEGKFSPDGMTAFLIANLNREQPAFCRIQRSPDGEPGKIELLAGRDDAELQEFHISEDGTQAVLVWNKSGLSELVFVNLETLVQSAGPLLPAEIVQGLSWSRDGSIIAMNVTGAATASNIWAFERESGRIWQVTHSPHAGVDFTTMVRPELVQFPAHDGLMLSGWLYRARNAAQPGSIVLTFHGGPEGQARPTFNDITQALLARGISVFVPNVRGSSGFGKTFVNLDNGPLRFDAIKDIQACVDYAVKAGIADAKRVGIMGGSYGGYMTMVGLTDFPDSFAAGVNLFGIVNFETFFQQTEPWMAAISKIEYGDPDTQVELLRQLSPIHRIDRVKAPTLVLHGANDTNVPVVEAEQVVESLRKRDIPVEYVLFPDEGHGFYKTQNRIRTAVAIVEWFMKYL
jgi:dipeptidyl aminopeptidase/acylaminoacyl peptidase